RQAVGHDDHHGRPRDERGRARGPARARTYRRYGAVFRGRYALVVPAPARGQKTLSGGPPARRVRDDRGRAARVEVQALVDAANAPNPRRLAVGLEQNRLAMLLAVLHRHAGIACFDQDVFLNAVGGVKITEPAADLAVLLAIHSSMRNKALPKGLIVFGEVGLAGEIRPSPRGQERLKEAAKLGFSAALISKAIAQKQPIDCLQVIAVERIEQAIDRVRTLE